MVYKKNSCFLPNSDKTEEIKLIISMYHKVDSSVSLGEPGYEERETIVNGLSVAAKVVYRYRFYPTSSLLLTINHKLTLFRIKQLEVLHSFSQLAL
jgi:hypothetical protein